MTSILDAHWNKWIAAPNGCYIWCAADNLKYGTIGHTNGRGKNGLVHRLVCEETHGPRASFLKLEASHLCGESHCVRPEHILWETHAENIARKTAEARKNPLSYGHRGRNSPPFTICKKNPKRPYWVRVTINNQRHTVGYFTTPEAAITARAVFLDAQQ